MLEDQSDSIAEQFTKKVVFRVSPEYEKKLPAAIDSNFEEVKRFIEDQTKKDKMTVVTPETMDAAKNRCALLNRQIKAIEDQRKEVKKNWNAPYAVFEEKCKELVKIITEAKDNLWTQVTEAEAKEKNEKEVQYKAQYEEQLAPELLQYFPYEKIAKSSWLNKSKSKKDVTEEIRTVAEGIQCDLKFLFESCNDEAEKLFVLKNYAVRKSISLTMEDLKSYRKEIQAMSKEKEKGGKEHTQKETAPESPKNEPQREEEREEDVRTIDFRIYATDSQLFKLKNFLVENKIKYGRVPNKTEE